MNLREVNNMPRPPKERCVCFLPLLLFWLPGNFHILFAMLAAVPFLQETWQLLRKAWNLPEPPPRKPWRTR